MPDTSTEPRRKGIRAYLGHAFAATDPGHVLTGEDHALLERVARWVARRRMSAPAVLFLESVRPMGYLGGQALVFFQPMVTTFLKADDYNRFTRILEKRETIGLLIDKITEAENRLLQEEKARRQKL